MPNTEDFNLTKEQADSENTFPTSSIGTLKN